MVYQCRWSRTCLQRVPCNANAASASDARSVTADTRPVGCSTPREEPQCCGCGGNHTASYRGCIKWKEAKATLAKRSPEGVRKSASTSQSAAPKAQRAGLSVEQTDLGEAWNHVVRWGRVVKATTTPTPTPNPTPKPATEAASQPKDTATRLRLGLRSPSQSLRQPVSRPLESQRRKQRVSKPRLPKPEPLN